MKKTKNAKKVYVKNSILYSEFAPLILGVTFSKLIENISDNIGDKKLSVEHTPKDLC